MKTPEDMAKGLRIEGVRDARRIINAKEGTWK